MKKALKILLPILLAIAVIGCMIWYLFVYDREFTRDVLLSQARYQESQGNYDMAAWFYDRAYDHANQDEDVAIELANQYKSIGNYTKAEYTLANAIADGGSADLYVALCKTYIEQNKLLDAVDMLDNISDPKIKAQLDALRPAAPTSNYQDGFYTEYISIELTVDSGKTYIRTNGQYPSITDIPYTQPITLAAGETTIYAVTVGENGLVSPLSIFGYTVGGVIEEVSFADAAVEALIREKLSVNDGTILYTDQLWTIEELTMPAEAADYSDLALLPYLRSLTIESGISDQLKNIGSLTRLEELRLLDCRPSGADLAIIAAIPTLTRLTLADCGLSSIADLEPAQKLTYLDLNGNTIRNISVLGKMPNLQEVYLAHNALTDLSVFANLTNLQQLDVSYNSIPSIAPICSNISLSWLDVSHNLIATLGAVDNLSNLTYFAAGSNALTDISQLAECENLEYLDLSNNSLIDISKLGSLNALQDLNFANNTVTELPKWEKDCALVTIDGTNNLLDSLDRLGGLENLNNVLMDYNADITSVDALASCHLLMQVNVYGTQVSDVSKLTDQGVLVSYNPTA